MEAKKRMKNDREVCGRELRKVDGLQRPGADLTTWLVEQIAELTAKDPI